MLFSSFFAQGLAMNRRWTPISPMWRAVAFLHIDKVRRCDRITHVCWLARQHQHQHQGLMKIIEMRGHSGAAGTGS